MDKHNGNNDELEEIIKDRIAREKRNADKRVQDAVEEAKRYAMKHLNII